MPVLLGQNEQKVLGDLLYDITSNTGLTRASPGSKTRAFAEAFSKKIGRMYTYFDTHLVQAFLSGATDRYLDFFGEMLGVPRLGQERADIASTHKNLRFYVEAGTFGDINGSSSILLPSGTVISTQAAGSGIRYTLTYDALLRATDSSTYVSAEAVQKGSRGNVGANRLIYHDFTSYDDSANNSLKVINEAEIASGQEAESNENYRYRLSNALTSGEKANQIAIRLAVLSVPGVADLVMEQYSRGLGSFDITVKSVNPRISAGLVAAVQEIVDKTKAYGTRATVKAPKEIGTSMSFTLTLNKAVTASDKEDIITDVQVAVSDYIDNLDIGEDLILNEVVQRVMETDNRIKDMGTVGAPFDTFYIYTPSRVEDSRIRTRLTQNYQAAADERVIIERENIAGEAVSVTIED